MVGSELQTICRKIAQQCEYGRIPPEYAIEAIDREIGGITWTYYDPKTFTIRNHEESKTISLDTRDQGSKVLKRRQQLARLGYLKAQEHGSRDPVATHFSREASTTHH